MKMKKIISYIILILLPVSCNNFLDYNEYDFINKEDVLTNWNRIIGMVTNLYGTIPSGYYDVGGSMRDCATDDAFDTDRSRSIHYMNDGRWSALRTVDNLWDNMYRGIRDANNFFRNYDISLIEPYRYTDNYMERIREFELLDKQAKFLRAYFYFELIKRYRNVPFLGDEVLTQDEVNNMRQTPFEEIVNYIVSECDAIIPALPADYTGIIAGDQKGRITKGVAMALKARVLLYAASPLHNTGNDRAKWISAARASYAIIDAKIRIEEEETVREFPMYSLIDNYSNVWHIVNSGSELILGRRRGAERTFEERNFPVGFAGASGPSMCPTQNLVDCYRMANGKKITDPASGYSAASPYENRDPRLQRTVIVNNSSYKSRPIEIWEGGRDGLPTQDATETGYYLKKLLTENLVVDPGQTRTTGLHCIVLFRYGEVLLNYAEAMNEAFGPNDRGEFGMTAYEAVNLIRARAGMPDFETGMTQAQFQAELRDERRVELAFEDHRFWDIRRWKIGAETSVIRGMGIVRNENGSFTYTPRNIEGRTWNDRMNFYPIPQSELFKNPNLVQNPGWTE